jgi:hypothetical protein
MGVEEPWIVGGGFLAALSILLLPQASTGLILLTLWCSAKLGLNTCMAALNGMVADQVPASQQGRLWGWVGLAQPLGLVLGVAVSTWLLPNLARAVLVQALFVVLCCLPTLMLRRRSSQHQGTFPAARCQHFALGLSGACGGAASGCTWAGR